MNKTRMIKEYASIILGTTVLAGAINVFFDANQLVVGGITGMGIILDAYAKILWQFSIPLWISNIILNIPLLLAAYYFLGKEFLGKTMFATIYLSIALLYTKLLPVFYGDMTLVAIYGGVFCGVGIGFVLRGFATTGGTDLAAAMIHKGYRHISVSQAIFVMDAAIIILGFFVFGAEKALYAIVSVFVTSKCIDTVLEGLSFSKAAFIISDMADNISDAILKNLNRGVTALYGKGMYTKEEKAVLLCVFSQKEMTRLKDIVKEIDKNAFILLTDVKEVLGEGFQNIDKI